MKRKVVDGFDDFFNILTVGLYGYFRKKYLHSGLKKAVMESNETETLAFLDSGAIANDLSILKNSVINKDKVILEMLLSHGGKSDISPPLANSYDGQYHTFSETHITYPLLEIAIANGDLEIIDLLLRKGINSHEGLQQALKENKMEIIIFLIEKSKETKKIMNIFKFFFRNEKNNIRKFYESLELKDHFKLDPILLSTAINSSNLFVVDLMLKKIVPEKNVLFNSIKNYKSGIFCALLHSFLLNNAVDLNLIKDENRKTLLHNIAIEGSKEQVVCLLNANTLIPLDINAMDDEMRTPIYYAFSNENYSVYNFLKSLGANERW